MTRLNPSPRVFLRCYCCEESADLKNVRVMYIDYGNTEWLSRDQTVLINDDLFELRPQGVLAKFSGTCQFFQISLKNSHQFFQISLMDSH